MSSYASSTTATSPTLRPDSSHSKISPVPTGLSTLSNGVNGSITTSQAIAQRIQVVDEQKQFKYVHNMPTHSCYHLLVLIRPLVITFLFYSTHLGQQIDKWGLQDVGFAYNIVAVFGSQSTGKSELLFCRPSSVVASPVISPRRMCPNAGSSLLTHLARCHYEE